MSIAQDLEAMEDLTSPLAGGDPFGGGARGDSGAPAPRAPGPLGGCCGDDRSTPALFFACGVGASLCYVSVLSSLVYFESRYGGASFVYLNVAVYLPLLPVAIAQAVYDGRNDARYGSANANLFRGVCGYAVSVGATAALPMRDGLVWACGMACLVGLAGAVLQGLLFQMAAFVPSSSRRGDGGRGLKAAVQAGVQGSALLSLAASLLVGVGRPGTVNDSREHFRTFCIVIASIEGAILLLFLLLMRQSRVRTSMVQRDSFLSIPDTESEGSDAGGVPADARIPAELSYRQLWAPTSALCGVLLLALVPSFLVGSWFTMVKSDLAVLPQILFYVRIFFDFLARVFAGWRPPSSVGGLVVRAALRLGLVAAFFVDASLDSLKYGDWISIALVAVISFGSGYLVTGCFQLAPGRLSPGTTRERNATKQAALLNVAFAVAASIGVLGSLGLAQVTALRDAR